MSKINTILTQSKAIEYIELGEGVKKGPEQASVQVATISNE